MKSKKSRLYLYTAFACILLIIGALYYYFFSDFSNKETVQYVYIDDDDTQDSVFAKLADVANYHSLTGFRTLARHSEYGQNIPEARTTERLAKLLSGKLMIDSATIAKSLKDSAFCAKYGYDTTTVVALFIPNTYSIYWNVSMDKFMERMKKEHRDFWNEERRQKAEAMGMNAVQVATMASIIDEETANNAEKPMIAGMYYNRIKAGMPLQADPTIKFAWKDFGLRRIYHKLLYIDSPYNTYKNTGLPPGPIKVASIAGIDAVLNHVDHDYLYMCAKEDFSGTHNFAKTYEEHLKNAARYSEALNKRGIK